MCEVLDVNTNRGLHSPSKRSKLQRAVIDRAYSMNRIETHPTTPDAPWVIVAAGVHRLGGTDKANFALVEYLLQRDVRVHVVTHEIDEGLVRDPAIRVERVPLPAGSRFIAEKLLSYRGRQVANRIIQQHPQVRVVVNGGNCMWGDINWVHRVHHAWAPETVVAPCIHRLKHRLAMAAAKRGELRSLRAAKLIIANSELTRRHLIEFIGVASGTIEVVQLGSESEWAPAGSHERSAARESLLQRYNRPMVAFVGAIGYDNNKGLDTLLGSWRQLCRRPDWDADLVIAGSGRALPQWRKMAAQSDFRGTVRFLGFTDRVPQLLAAADLLVSPVRYESYGLNVQEALCRGVPAIVSQGAGVAERYPSELQDLLLPNPEDVDDLARRMLMWRSGVDSWRERVSRFSAELRAHSWQDMAARFYSLAVLTPAERAKLPA